MDKKNRRILEYLSEKEWIAEGVAINSLFEELELSKEEVSQRFRNLYQKEYVKYNQPHGDRPFIQITERGIYALRTFKKKSIDWVLKNLIPLLILTVALLNLYILLSSES